MNYGAVFRRLSLVFFALFVLPLLYLVEPFWRFRIGDLPDGRIGHLAPNLDLFARRLQLGLRPPRTTYIFISYGAANTYLLSMWRRHFVILKRIWFRRIILGILPLLEKTRFHQPLPYEGTEHRIFTETVPVLGFTAAEEELGNRLLEGMGIGPKDWFVCFHTRDSAYLKQRLITQKQEITNEENIRNASIQNYMKAAEWITKQGGFAVRMGGAFLPSLVNNNPHIIDYATKFRTDFMDLFVISRCRFFLGAASGLHGVAYLFNKPCALANFMPLEEIAVGQRCLYIPKFVHHKDTGRRVSFRLLKKMGLFASPSLVPIPWVFLGTSAEMYASCRLGWKENTPEEILDLCRDMMDRLGDQPLPEGSVAIQNAYRNLFEGPNSSEFAARLGPRFALRHEGSIV